MQLLIVVDTFVPARISAALQMCDLVSELRCQGHDAIVLVPAAGLGQAWALDDMDGTPVLRVAAPRNKDVGKARRLLAEMWLPYALLRGLRKSPLAGRRWDGVVWYSPSIFLGPAVAAIARRSRCRKYLILRDLFPDWAVDSGLLRKGLLYRFFKWVERRQYALADVIGVQTPANLPIVRCDAGKGPRLEVLNNWLAKPALGMAPLDLSAGPLAGRTVFAYTGNMGAAQAMDAFIELAARLRARQDIGFLFVGRGSELARLRARVSEWRLENVLFVDEIDADQVPGLLSQCHVGIIALDPRHTTHNIPGKLITYLHAGLPVIARINPGNDLEGLINAEKIGLVVAGDDPEQLEKHARRLADDSALRQEWGRNGNSVAARMFSPATAARQVLRGLSGAVA